MYSIPVLEIIPTISAFGREKFILVNQIYCIFSMGQQIKTNKISYIQKTADQFLILISSTVYVHAGIDLSEAFNHHTHAHQHTCTHTHIYIHTYIIQTHTSTHTNAHNINIHVTHTHTYTHTHTRTHTHNTHLHFRTRGCYSTDDIRANGSCTIELSSLNVNLPSLSTTKQF